MQNRIAAVAGFLATATLLSGNAFAFAPDFEGDLPTVIITDQLSVVTDPSAPFDSLSGTGVATTEYVFRFSDAFSMQDYIVDLRGNDINAVQFLFNEYDNTDPEDLTINSVGTLSINGETALGSIPATGDWSSAPLVLGPSASNPAFDFRNIDFSPVGGQPFDAIGDLTGHDLIASGPQERRVELYLKGDTAEDVDISQFLVITATMSGTDGLSEPFITDPWTVVADPADLDGWLGSLSPDLASHSLTTGLPDTDGATDTAQPFSFSPGVDGAGAFPANTPSITVSSAAATSNGDSLALTGDFTTGVAPVANRLYRLRANVYSNTGTGNQSVRLYMGSTNTTGVGAAGYLGLGINTGSTPTPTDTANELNAYLYAKADVADLPVFFDIVNGDTPVAAQYTIAGYDISEADGFDALGSSTPILNIGGAVDTLATGETLAPLASPDAFGSGAGAVTVGLTPAQPGSSNVNTTAGRLEYTFNTVANTSEGFAPGSIAFVDVDTFFDYSSGTPVPATKPADITAAPTLGNFLAEDGKLYAIEVWASLSGAGTVYPDLRIGAVGEGNQFAYGLYNLDTASAVGLETGAKAYVCIYEAQDGDDMPVSLQLFFISIGNKTYTTNSTFFVHRIAVREYNAQ